jgi:hypothetical protein
MSAGAVAIPIPADVLKESGFVASNSRTYRNGDKSAQMTLYSFRDSSGAYEAFGFLKANTAGANPGTTLILKSNVALWIQAPLDFATEDLAAVKAWVQSVSDGVTSPPVATYLPNQGKQPLSERYALGPVAFAEATRVLGQADWARLIDQAGFNSGAEAMFAQYKSGVNHAVLLLIEYPTPQLAELHLKHMQRAIAATKNGASVERKGSLLSIVLAPTSQEYAEKLREAVNYETQVTWSEPSTTATDPPIMSTLVKIIIATGMFMVVTVVVGIAFGGVRIITKRLFPGKVFDRKNQIEVLQLGLSGKPIDPTDMY